MFVATNRSQVFCSHVYGNKTQLTKIFIAQQPLSLCHLFMRFVDNQENYRATPVTSLKKAARRFPTSHSPDSLLVRAEEEEINSQLDVQYVVWKTR